MAHHVGFSRAFSPLAIIILSFKRISAVSRSSSSSYLYQLSRRFGHKTGDHAARQELDGHAQPADGDHGPRRRRAGLHPVDELPPRPQGVVKPRRPRQAQAGLAGQAEEGLGPLEAGAGVGQRGGRPGGPPGARGRGPAAGADEAGGRGDEQGGDEHAGCHVEV
ncbi:hypothetical protein TPAR_04099 [Tolypocladium paradoxum]|uniref:Uncharacterized protein n=1 Tax=Tolypocladium paradoxum TaxID=94208 RepID=A0A2S4KZS3_9HYPO|nr:hypothetical protein TPAR_04099 [Tolypocladium paradoxum]